VPAEQPLIELADLLPQGEPAEEVLDAGSEGLRRISERLDHQRTLACEPVHET